MQSGRGRVADMLLWLIGIVGIVPLVFMAPATISSGAGLALADFSLLGHVGAVVFALIFMLGAGLCVYRGSATKLVLTLPALLVALLPAFLNLSPRSVSEDMVERLARIENPWVPAGINLRTLMEKINAQNAEKLPQDRWENVKWEYAILRNGGLRPLTFSTWNGGIRALTTPYLRGDYVSKEQKFTLGWSMWILGTRDPSDDGCADEQVRHHYLRGDRQGVTIGSGNGCQVEGRLFKRRRHIALTPDLQG